MTWKKLEINSLKVEISNSHLRVVFLYEKITISIQINSNFLSLQQS
jgi:hypothetical protein